MAGPIRIAILANASQARKELSGVAKETKSFGQKMKGAGKVAGLALAAGAAAAGAAALKLGADSVKAASDAQQSLGATETVFGKFAKSVIDNSNKAATSVGLSANEYRELANVMGASLNGAGIPLKKTAALTDDINKRAADMAATFGGTTRNAVEAIGSLMRGEADPIERYGVSIKQADVSARLAAQGLDGLTGEARKQAEMQARLDLLMQKTTKTQGAFKKESGTLAHQQQVLSAQFENIKAKIGTALLPVLTRVFTYLNKTAIPAAQRIGSTLKTELAPWVEKTKKAFSDLQGMLEPVGAWFSKNPGVLKGVGIALGIAAAAAGVFALAMGAVALVTSPITLVVLAVAALGAGIALLWQKSETFRTVTISVWEAVKSTVSSVLASVQSIIKSAVTVVLAVWKKFGGTILSFIRTTFQNVAQVIKGVLQVIKGVFKVFSSALKGDWRGVWNGIKSILSGALKIIKGILSQAWNSIKTATSLAWAGIKSVISKVWDGIKTAVSAGIGAVVTVVKTVKGKITGAFKGAGTWLKSIGDNIIKGLGAGIEAAREWLKQKVEDLSGWIPGWIKRKLGIASPSKVTYQLGKYTGQGLGLGLTASTGMVSKAAIRFADTLIEKIQKRLDADTSLRDSILSLRESIAGSLTGDLFGGTGDEESSALTKFRNSLEKAKKTAAEVAKATASLLGKGVTQKFLDGLMSSGNTELIVELGAANDAAALASAYESVLATNNATAQNAAEAIIGTRLDEVNHAITVGNQELIKAMELRAAEDKAQRKAERAEDKAQRKAERAEDKEERKKDRKEGMRMEVNLNSQEVDQLSRGKGYKADIKAYEKAGGK